MTRLPLVAKRVEELLGSSVIATAPVAGGEISTTTRVRLSNGITALVKTHHQAPDGFFDAEARGLAWLGEARREGGVAVPEVLAHDHECLVLRWVESGKNTVDAATTLGQSLARTHRAGADAFGADQDGFIGRLPMPNRTAPSWPEFYATRRVLPYLKLARDRGAVTEEDGAAIEGVLRRLTDLIPEEPPARLHGDLWNGNVLWGLDGACRVIDPAAYGGHREVDLAMLALFGLPHLHRVLDAYEEEHPLADGWRDRLGLHQLFPLLVHAC
ncbi:MAG: fructosamine kinase family protein, partial [Nocardioides sp.]